MKRLPSVLYLAAIIGMSWWSAVARADDPQPDLDVQTMRFFESKVRPLLADHCLECHGAETQESGLRLDSRAAILRGGEGGQVVVVGKAHQSRLLRAVRGQGELEKMPPDSPLSAEQIEILESWIQRGLPWPRQAAALSATASRRQQIQEAARRHWSFQPLRRPDAPSITNASWPNTPLDVYVLAGLESAGLQPSPTANRATLIRRLTFDLHGIPPMPGEVESFINDERPDAYPRLVDRLLASPRYGERWGRHWLDVARYADTKGYAFGKERRFAYAYTYRDYVISSLNQDKPYHRFVKEQLAADLLPDADSHAKAGLGLLTVGRRFNNRHDDIDDQIDVVGRGLLGLTISCARCHDHKYDAIPTEDYYSLYGVFASCGEPAELPVIGDPSTTAGYARFQAELEKRRGQLQDFLVEKHGRLLDVSRLKTADYLVRVVSGQPEELLKKLPFLSLGEGELKPRLVQRWRDYLSQQAKPSHPVLGPWSRLASISDAGFSKSAAPQLQAFIEREAGLEPGQINPLVKTLLVEDPPATLADVARIYGQLFTSVYQRRQAASQPGEAAPPLSLAEQQIGEVIWGEGSATDIALSEIRGYLTRADRNRMSELQKLIDSHQVDSPDAPPRAMVLRDNATPHDPRVFIRGNHGRPGESVPRQFVRLLAGDQRQPFAKGSGRLELAEAIVDPQNPLTRRVIANRIWMHHFGASLVDTPSDFGSRCPEPEQRALLDYLAWSLGDSGWSLKRLHREIVLSSTYRQASLDRDEARQRDPENRFYWRMNRRRLEYEALRDALFFVSGQLDARMFGRPVDLMQAPFAGRRAVYGFIDRQDLPNLLRVFDFASPDQSSPRRPQTIVPQQALFLMNSPLVAQRAAALLQRPDVQRHGSPRDRIQALYEVLYSRVPTPRETQISLQFLESAEAADADIQNKDQEQNKQTAWQQYAQLLLLANEFIFVD